jgi:hypothetical protein
MKIDDMFERNKQDEKIENTMHVMEFRECFFANAKATQNAEANRLATTLAHALFGLASGYRPCCVIEFCKHTYGGTRKPISKCPSTGAVLCSACEKDIKPTLG